MFDLITKLFSSNERHLRNARKTLKLVNQWEPEIKEMSYEQMQGRIKNMKEQLQNLVEKTPKDWRESLTKVQRHKAFPDYEQNIHKKLMEFAPELFAMIRETYSREFGIRHYDVQILGGILLAESQRLAEIKTGEGKTMIFNLPLFLYSLVGRGAHLVTANDYLARRDAEYAGHIANKLGLTVGVVISGASLKFADSEEVRKVRGEDAYKEITGNKLTLAGMKGLNLLDTTKKEAYLCDMTFSVNNELGFDYLRDNMANNLSDAAQRELYFCIVDEADSILIDEARTPLIISAVPADSDTSLYRTFAQAVKGLEEEEDFTVDHKSRSVLITDKGIAKVEKALGVENLWADFSMAHHIENALKAKVLFLNDQEYIVKNGEVLIVDTFTGRILEGRRFSEGLHQAIEAKEGVEIQKETKTFATITFQNFFRLYKYLCGGSGTIMTEQEEFFKIYSLESVAVPTNKPVLRKDMPDRIYANQDAKFKAVAQEVKERHENGQPVLVGTTSVEKSEKLSSFLDQLGVPHEVLNAKYHEREAQIVAKAGQPGAVTVATNMAGRGTDIPITDEVREVGGLAVIGTERHESRRIDNQLRGRSGRQGDPGYSRFYAAMDDTIMRILGGDLLKATIGRIMDDDAPIEMSLITRQIETAQKRVEWSNFDSRKNVVEFDDVLSRQREVFYSRRKQMLNLTDNITEENKEEVMNGLKDTAWEMVSKDMQGVLSSKYTGSQITETDLHDLVANILDLGPDRLVASGWDVSNENLAGTLANLLRGKKFEQNWALMESALRKMFDAKVSEFGEDFPRVLKMLFMDAMTQMWMDHLETMQDIRSGIGLQGYAQKNPLVEYKSIGFRQFQKLMNDIDNFVTRRLFKVMKVQQVQTEDVELSVNADEIHEINTGSREMTAGDINLDKLVKNNERKLNNLAAQAAAASGNGAPSSAATKNGLPKVGRNDPCPCGSGKKYKHCHGR